MAVNENQSEGVMAARSEDSEYEAATQSEYEEARIADVRMIGSATGAWPVGVRAVAVADNGKLKLSLRVSITFNLKFMFMVNLFVKSYYK
jgi:hypothetical protein